jgi:hypothetical protein
MRQRPKEHFADEDNSDKSCSEMGSADMQDFDEWTDESMKSVLTVSKAHHLGKRFFGRRHGISRLEKITVRTGEKLRDDSPRLAIYLPSEDQYERIFEIYPPPTKGDNPLLKEMESKLAQMRRETNERLDRMFRPVKRVIVKDRE